MHHTRKWHPLSFFVEARSNKRFSISGSWRSHIPRSLEFNFSHWGFLQKALKVGPDIKVKRPSTNFMHPQMSLSCPQIFLWHGMWSVIYRQSSLATQLSDSKATAAVTAAAAAATTRAERTHSETTLAEASEKADSRAEPRCATTCPRNCNQATNAVAVGEFSAATSAAGGRPSVISLH
jgi:hypothetical protein